VLTAEHSERRTEILSAGAAMNAIRRGVSAVFVHKPGRGFTRSLFVWAQLSFFFGALCVLACTSNDSDQNRQCLIRSKNSVVTVEEFQLAYETAVGSYPADILYQPEVLKKIKLQVLNQLIEEMILSERGKELGIEITGTALNEAVADIRREYSDEEFEDMLLTLSMPFSTWKQAVKKRLLIQTVIEKDLVENVVIRPEEITARCRQIETERAMVKTGQTSEESEKIRENIFRQLRREKAEAGYADWLKSLRTRFEVEIEGKIWETLANS